MNNAAVWFGISVMAFLFSIGWELRQLGGKVDRIADTLDRLHEQLKGKQ